MIWGEFARAGAIRTLEINGNTATLGIGSGIVADSEPEREWDEALLKATFVTTRPQMFGLYEAFRYVPESGFRNLEEHLTRLEHSCMYFSRPFPRDRILCKLEELRGELGDAPNRVRLDLDGEDIALTLIPEELAWNEAGVKVMLAEHRLDPGDARLYHKTTGRPEKLSLRAKAKSLGADECLFLNTRGEFCEGTLSNVLIKIGGKWITPKLSCGLLPGVWRDHQVHDGRVVEGIVRYDQFSEIEEIVIGNSVRGEGRVISVILEDGTEIFSARRAIV